MSQSLSQLLHFLGRSQHRLQQALHSRLMHHPIYRNNLDIIQTKTSRGLYCTRVLLKTYFIYIPLKWIHFHMNDHLGTSTPNWLSMSNTSHPMIPPLRPPLDQSSFSSEMQLYNTLLSDIRLQLAMKTRFDYRDNDHPDRENPLIINEVLYQSDHDKILDEMKFNFVNQAQQKEVSLDGVALRHQENARLHAHKLAQLRSRIRPSPDYL